MMAADLFGGKILRVYILVGKNQPANFDKTDHQTIQIIYFIFFVVLFHGRTKRRVQTLWSVLEQD